MADKKTVLIVEDDKKYRTILVKLLTAEGITTQTAADGVEALQKLKGNTQIDLIILDLLMPRMSGWNFMYEIQKIPSRNIPIIILTNLTALSYPSEVPVQLDLMMKANVSIDEVVKKVKKHLMLE